MEQSTQKSSWPDGVAPFESKEKGGKIIKNLSEIFIAFGLVAIFFVFSPNENFSLGLKIAVSIVGLVYIVSALLLRKFRKIVIANIVSAVSIIGIIIIGLDSFFAFAKIEGLRLFLILIVSTAGIYARKVAQAIHKYNAI